MAYDIDRIAESFVKKAIKFNGTTSAGEGKLYIGPTSSKSSINSFFNNFGPSNTYKFDKDNFIEYLHSVKFEYMYQLYNKYNSVDLAYWQKALQTIEGLASTDFYFDAQLYDDSRRLYIETTSRKAIFYEYFRSYALPDITEVKIEASTTNPNEFIFKLYLRQNLTTAPKTAAVIITGPRSLDGEYYNKIVYGAPGTGKSHSIKQDSTVFGKRMTRVTFYPDYSYSKFVGSYKPFTYYKTPSDNTKFFDAKNVSVENAAILNEPVIDYVFQPGPFLLALVEAYISDDPYLLIIEEINRANAAAVFGEVFQLLDRKDGTSVYTVKISEEATNYLKAILGAKFSDIEDGIYIPKNLYIWATMNSADQGVFHMDSAFKRRWSFEYLELNKNEGQFAGKKITFSGKDYEWNKFRKVINDHLIANKVTEDRLIGPFFLNETELSDPLAIKNKLLLYLRDDVLRHNFKKLFVPDTFGALMTGFDSDSQELFVPEVMERLSALDDASDS